MTRVANLLAGLIGAALLVFGVYALFAVTTITDMTALTPQGVAGLSEARAVYAGLFVAMGALVLYGLWTPAVRRPLLIANGIIFGGFVAARLISIAMDGYDPMLNAAIGSEIVAALVLLAAGLMAGRTASA